MQELKKVLIVSSYCFENSTANGICARTLFDCMSKIDGVETHILGLSDDTKCCDSFEHRITPKDFNLKSSNLGRISALKKILTPQENHVMINSYYKAISELDEMHHFDIIIAMFFPPEIVSAVTAYKKRSADFKFVIYELDSFTDGIVRNNKGIQGKLYRNAKIRWMRRQYFYADQIFIMDCHRNEVESLYEKYRHKLDYVDLPLLRDNTVHNKIINDSKCRFLYTGELNQIYRNPQVLINAFSSNSNCTEWELHFFSKGDCENLLSEAAKKDERITCHGYVDNATLTEYFDCANFLISIGNASSNSMPSKVINYISMGIPIIHFCMQEYDVAAELLSKHPLALIIPFSSSEDDIAKQIRDFVSNNKGKTIDYQTVKAIYPNNLPDTSARLILS